MGAWAGARVHYKRWKKRLLVTELLDRLKGERKERNLSNFLVLSKERVRIYLLYVMQAEPTPEAEKVIVRFFKHLIRRRTLDSLRRTEGAQVVIRDHARV